MKKFILSILSTLLFSSVALAADSRISNAAALAACNAIVDLVDGGASAGALNIYSGTPPTNVDAVATGTLLAELPLSDPAFGNCADANPNAEATANAITSDTNANATGTAGYYRFLDSDGNAIFQGDITATSGGGNIEIGSTSIASGDTVSVSSFVFRQKEAQ